MRKRHTPVLKAQIVREMLKEDQTQAQIASRHGVHPNLMRQWKEIALNGLPRLFEPGQDLAAQAAGYEARINELYAEIGRLTTQFAWLKKNYRCKSHSTLAGAGRKPNSRSPIPAPGE